MSRIKDYTVTYIDPKSHTGKSTLIRQFNQHHASDMDTVLEPSGLREEAATRLIEKWNKQSTSVYSLCS